MKKTILFLILVISSYTLFAQISDSGTPQSFLIRTKAAIQIPQKMLDAVDTSKYLADDIKQGITNRYGIVQQASIDIKTQGVKTIIIGKGNIWQYRIQSSNAYSLGIYFKSYLLPDGASVFIYNENHTLLIGAFTSKNNNAQQELTIADFKGSHAIIEYFEPYNPTFGGELAIGSISQAYKDIQQVALASRIGINCPVGTNWQDEKHAVCRMTFNDTQYSYFCTGFLINNVKADGTPYFQTANHCISTNIEASTLVTYFNYENSSCSSNDANAAQTLSGATLVSNNSYTDFSLLLLREYPPIDYNPYFAGWDASNRNPQSGTSIHHPEGTPKSIALDYNAPTNYPYSTQWTDENNNVISTTTPNVHWEVKFDAGETEPGSSGSPLFDDQHRIIGQLHGGGGNSGDLYSKFSVSWNYSPVSTKQLQFWLDPDKTGTQVMDGTYFKIKPKAGFSTSFTNVCLATPVKFTNQSRYLPKQWFWKISPSSYQFVNGSNNNSSNPEIIFSNPGLYTVSLTVSNSFGSDSVIKTNYINAGNLKVALSGVPSDSIICGYNLANYTLVASGAENYRFTLERNDKVDYKTTSDSIKLSLKSSEKKNGSFSTWVKVTGTQGTCISADSALLKISMPVNDNIQNAITLLPGRNIAYSNFCASVQSNEPYPLLSDCISNDSWCQNGNTLQHSIWFKFWGPTSGKITIDTHGFNNRIAVYDADSSASIMSGNLANYKIIAANDNRSAIDNTALLTDLMVEPGKFYWLQVDGYQGATGSCIIDLISNSLDLFPNPTSGPLNIFISNSNDGNANVEIFSIVGSLVYTNNFPVTTTSNHFNIDVSSLSSGLYVIKVNINGTMMSKKFVIARTASPFR